MTRKKMRSSLAKPQVSAPAFRRLRGYAFDPSLSTVVDTAGINQATFEVPWESLKPGPIGEYLEVVDHDPVSRRFYEPVDLEHPHVLAQDGLEPSEGYPQAHQQMVYAVAMTTIRHFERALGRKVLWATGPDYDPVGRLRIYPHALRGANAYYSPEMKALLFGYFEASEEDTTHVPGATVFTCLSHDIIAHETTHALLDGMHRRFIEPTHPDSLAFHEAFADLVALFQHFSFPEVLRHQIAKTRGKLSSTSNLLGELAQEFGRALGSHGALRSALNTTPDPSALATTFEPHARGSILVAAVFEAFTLSYERRAERLIELATSGSGVLPPGALPSALVAALANEAAKTAEHFLGMCIRALDYCPPVGLTFGDYLRAIITSDCDMVPKDSHGYRLTLVDAFRRRGIVPQGVRSLAEESLLWPPARDFDDYDAAWLGKRLRDKTDWMRYEGDRERIFWAANAAGAELHQVLSAKPESGLYRFARVCGLELGPNAPREIERNAQGMPKFEVHQFRTAFRARPDGTLMNHATLSLTQSRKISLPGKRGSYKFRGGATLIVDLDTLELRYCIRRPIGDEERRASYEAYMLEELPHSIRTKFFENPGSAARLEPFAFLHGEGWQEARYA